MRTDTPDASPSGVSSSAPGRSPTSPGSADACTRSVVNGLTCLPELWPSGTLREAPEDGMEAGKALGDEDGARLQAVG